MKSSLRLLAAAALLVGVSALAQDSATAPRDRQFLPPAVLNSDGSITLPDGSVLPALPGPMFNSDGSITLPDGTVVQPNSDGTYTLPDGHVIDLSKAPPVPPRRDLGRGRRGPPPATGKGG